MCMRSICSANLMYLTERGVRNDMSVRRFSGLDIVDLSKGRTVCCVDVGAVSGLDRRREVHRRRVCRMGVCCILGSDLV